MLTADDDGRFSTDGLAPGRYSVSVEVVVEGRRRARLSSATLVDIPPGGDIARDFAVTAGHLRVRITDAGGQGIARRLIEVTDPANGFAVGRQTDPAGWIEVAPIATGTYRIRVHSAPAAGNGAAPGTADARGEPGDARQRGPAKGRLVDLGEIVVQAGSAPSTASFVVPAK
jgi:hypothetical protein